MAMHLVGLNPDLRSLFERLTSRGIEVPREQFATWSVEQVYAAVAWVAVEPPSEPPDFLKPLRRSDNAMPPKLKSPPKKTMGATDPSATQQMFARRRARLKVALEPTDEARAHWATLAREGASDQVIYSAIKTVLGAEGCAQTDDGPLCWNTLNGTWLGIWFDEESPPAGRLPDLEEIRIVIEVRQIYGILPGVDRRKEPAKGNGRLADHKASAVIDERSAASATPRAGEPDVRNLPVALIDRFPLNPRDELEFDEASLRALGTTLAVRQVQACVVRVHPEIAGRYQLIAGERRWRAARLVGMETLRCELVTATDAEAVWMCGQENEKRKDWSAIAQAKWFRELKRAENLTDTQLAKRVGVSQAQATSTMGLLELPEDFQRRIITREISPTIARHLIPWARKRPQVIAAVAKALRLPGSGAATVRDDDEPITTRVMEDAIREALRDCTRSTATYSPRGYNSPGHPLFSIDKKLRELLDCESLKIHSWGDGEVRAWNVEEWDRRQKEAKKKQKEKAKAERKENPEGNGGNPRQNEQVQEWWIEIWVRTWQSTLFAARLGEIADKATREKLAFFLFSYYEEDIFQAWGWKKPKIWSDPRLRWRALAGLTTRDISGEILGHVRAAIERDAADMKSAGEWRQTDAVGLGHEWNDLGQVVGIDWAEEFTPDARLLDCWPLADLNKFPFGQPKTTQGGKPALIEHIVEKWQPGWLPKEVRALLGLPNEAKSKSKSSRAK